MEQNKKRPERKPFEPWQEYHDRLKKDYNIDISSDLLDKKRLPFESATDYIKRVSKLKKLKDITKPFKIRIVKQKYSFWVLFLRILLSPILILLIIIASLISCFRHICNYFKYGCDITIFDKNVNKIMLRDVFKQNQKILENGTKTS